MGVLKALDNEINEDNNFDKSFKNLSPNINGSLAPLSPNKTSGDCITVLGESIFTLFTEFKLIVSLDVNNIESDLALSSNLPESKII